MRIILNVVVIILTFNVTVAWAQDQASSPKAQVSSPSISVGGSFCPKGKDYFERSLHAMALTNITNAKDPADIPLPIRMVTMKSLYTGVIHPKCVESAMEHVSAGPRIVDGKKVKRANNFFVCNANNRIAYQVDEPCTSSNYVKMVHHSFELATVCLKDFVSESKDPKIQNDWVETYFEMLTQESGLHVNVKSPSGPIGTGQLSEDYMEHFEKATLGPLREHLNNHKWGLCRQIARDLLNDKKLKTIGLGDTKASGDARSCGLTRVEEGQPLLNIVISFSHLRVYKSEVRKALYQEHADLFKSLSAADRASLERRLTVLSYNMGSRGLSRALQPVLSNYDDREVAVTNPNLFIKQVTAKAGQLKGKSPDRLDEMSSYLDEIDERYASVLAKAKKEDPSITSCRLK